MVYTDGVIENRQWRVTITEEGVFGAESDSLVGAATGLLKGNALQMAYSMNVDLANEKQWLLDMDDWMFLQPDASLHNITNVSKWGIKIGTVSTQYTRISNDEVPQASQTKLAVCK